MFLLERKEDESMSMRQARPFIREHVKKNSEVDFIEESYMNALYKQMAICSLCIYNGAHFTFRMLMVAEVKKKDVFCLCLCLCLCLCIM